MKRNTRIGKKMTDYRLPITDKKTTMDSKNRSSIIGHRSLAFAKRFGGARSVIAARGFTILELLAVVFIISLIAAIAIPRYQRAILKAREAALKQNLHVMRSVIDQYFADKKRYPDSLETLVGEGYLRSVPVDPFTESSGTWQTIPPESNPFGPPEESGGVYDVKSGASGIGTNSTPYGDW